MTAHVEQDPKAVSLNRSVLTRRKYHEEAYCCSRVGHADCRADVRSVRKCGTRVTGEFLVRRQWLLRAGEHRNRAEWSTPYSKPLVENQNVAETRSLKRLAAGPSWFGLADGTPIDKIDDQTFRIATNDTVLHRRTG
jgi:hypothetical protein